MRAQALRLRKRAPWLARFARLGDRPPATPPARSTATTTEGAAAKPPVRPCAKAPVPSANHLENKPFALALVLGACVLASPIVQTARSHPWGLSAYTPLVGGASGAATLGLNRTFWGYTTGSVAPYLATAPRGASVFLHDTLNASWDMLQADGRVRADLRPTMSIDASSYALYHHEQHSAGVEYPTWIAYEMVRSAYISCLHVAPSSCGREPPAD